MPGSKNKFAAVVLTVVFSLMTLAFAAERQIIKIREHIPTEALMHSIGPMDPEQSLRLAVALPVRNKTQRDQLLQGLYDPKSPEYRHYLTPSEYAERFGTTQADYNTVVDFFKNQGYKVTTSAGRLLLDVNGTVRMVETTCHMKLRLYKTPAENRIFFAPDANNCSMDLDVPLLSILGLDDFSKPCPAWGCEGPPKKQL